MVYGCFLVGIELTAFFNLRGLSYLTNGIQVESKWNA